MEEAEGADFALVKGDDWEKWHVKTPRKSQPGKSKNPKKTQQYFLPFPDFVI
jgi:hypothetical protein